jgi:hypothetical protein
VGETGSDASTTGGTAGDAFALAYAYAYDAFTFSTAMEKDKELRAI